MIFLNCLFYKVTLYLIDNFIHIAIYINKNPSNFKPMLSENYFLSELRHNYRN